MSWSVIIDPPAIAASPPNNRTPLDLNTGSIRIDQKGLDWGDAQVQTYMADRRVGSVKVDFRVPNRKVSIPLFLLDDDAPGGTGRAEEDARAMLQQKVGLLQMRGGWLMRQRAGGQPTYADVVDAVLTLPDVWGETGSIEPSVNLILECSPDFYGDEIDLDAVTVTGGALSGPLQLSGSDAVIDGDHLGRAQINVTDTSGVDQGALIWAFRGTFYDSASTAALIYDAATLDPVDPAFAPASIAGEEAVCQPSLGTSWTPILNTNVGGVQPFTHIGSYRVRARVYTSSSTSVWLRFVWGVGAAIGLIQNPLLLIPGINNFYIVDLGEIRVDASPVGPTRWEGQIQGMGAAGGEVVYIDKLYFQPLDDAAGYATANPSVVALTSPAAADFFTESAGDLGGKTATAGGNWTEVGTPVLPPQTQSSTAMSNVSGAGTQAWTGPAGTGPPGPDHATIASIAINTVSQNLEVSGFGFSIPSTATIVGVEVDMTRSAGTNGAGDSSTGTTGFPGMRLQNGGTAMGTDQNAGAIPTTAADHTYGGPTNLWGATLTPAIVNSTGFGFMYCAFNGPAGSVNSIQISGVAMTIYYTLPGSLNIVVNPTNQAAERTVADENDHFALLGSAIADTNVSADVGWSTIPAVQIAGGLVARYQNPTNYLVFYLWGPSTGNPQVILLKVKAGSVTNITTVTLPTRSVWPTLPLTFHMQLIVDNAGLIQTFFDDAPIYSTTDPDLAAGGALATGSAGIYHPLHSSTAKTAWQNFLVYDVTNSDATVFGNASAALRYDGMYRTDPSNTYFGPIANVVGDLPRLPPSGIEQKPVELFLLLSRGDLQTKSDASLGTFTAQVRYRPVYIHRT